MTSPTEPTHDAFADIADELNQGIRDSLKPAPGTDLLQQVAMALAARNILQDKDRYHTGEAADSVWLMTTRQREIIPATIKVLFRTGMFNQYANALLEIMEIENEDQWIAQLGIMWCSMMEHGIKAVFSVDHQLGAWAGEFDINEATPVEVESRNDE